MKPNLAAALGAAMLTLGASAHADTITANGFFDVTYRGGFPDDEPVFDPPLEGSGVFSIVEDLFSTFQFSMLGFM